MNHELHVFVGERRIARIEHAARDDFWSMAYAPNWIEDPQAFPLSPMLPLRPAATAYASASIKRFIEHLLPEGRALDVVVEYNNVSKNNVFGLIRALGAETAGALRFAANPDATLTEGSPPRIIELAELDQRIQDIDRTPLTVWDSRVRLSVAGLQDKLLVYINVPLSEGGQLYLVDGARLASTHILKPDTGNVRTPHLAVNEHFCMSLARKMGLPAAPVQLLRTPRAVLVVRRFDRHLETVDGRVWVTRRHIIDACQACDLPVSFKYERNFGSAPEVRNIREGMSFERLFGCATLTGNKATARQIMLRWALFQFLIGNSDAHGKNFSFFVQPDGVLEPTPWYDLVSVLQYDGFDVEFAMGFGDVFVHEQLTPFALADFATRCGIDRKVLRREAQRMARLARTHATQQAQAADYLESERAFTTKIASFVNRQAEHLVHLAEGAAAINDDLL